MTKVNRAWHTREDQEPLIQVGLSKKIYIERNNERDESIYKMMTHLDVISKHVM